MKEDIREGRAAAFEELKAALAELESGQDLTRFVGGHGFQGRVFQFEWSDPVLAIDFRLPYSRVLSGDAESDNEEIGAAIRMAMLLLMVDEEPIGRVSVVCDDLGTLYYVFAGDGSLEDSGEDWSPLVRRLDGLLPEKDTSPMTIILP